MTLPEFVAALQLPFISRALLTVLVLALAAGVISVLVSFRSLEFITDGLVHAVFPGLVIGYLIGGSALLLPGALVAALIAVVIITLLTHRGLLGNDAAIAVMLTSAFSLGVVLVSKQSGYVGQLQSLLFGHLLTVTPEQLAALTVTAALALLLVLITWRRQLFRAHDAAGFVAAGYSLLATDLLLGAALALLVVAGAQALGNLLVIALLIVPAAAARQLTGRLWLLPLTATALILLAGFGGISFAVVASFSWGANVSAGAAVVLLLVLLYLLCVLVRRARQSLRRARAGWAQTARSTHSRNSKAEGGAQ